MNNGGDDGLCIEEVYIDYVPMNMATPKYLDICEEENLCPYDEYQESLIVFKCQGFQGQSDVNMIIGNEIDIVSIPKDVVNLELTLKSGVDIDLQL